MSKLACLLTDLKITVNLKETLEAKELLRQHQSKDGSIENLVRWCLSSREKKVLPSNSAPNARSSSNCLPEETNHESDVFLWMTNRDMQVCCPHLCGNEGQSDLSAGVKNESQDGSSETSQEVLSDMEDVEDMRLDVIKLVQRAKKQMQCLKKEVIAKPPLNLSRTIKVLSTYAGLGLLAGVFRETGALDLILDLLWTNDVDTRRAAGGMLQALALHDAGSRAYVLLSLTQDSADDELGQTKHYADFENRAMVMEMFAQTASSEEAHAVTLDSVQLPQVPGRALFTLMKCYLRVMSLMDATSNASRRPGKKSQLSWMILDEKFDIESARQFEVAMAISDLIFELNRIMDWNNANWKPQKKEQKEDEKLLGLSSASGKKCEKYTPQQLLRKPLFTRRYQDNVVDADLLSCLLKQDQPGPTYKHPSSFTSRRQYGDYLRENIKPGFRVRACQHYQDVNEGDEGIYRKHNESTPPVQVFWHRLNRPFWVHWHHLQIIGSDSDPKASPEPPEFITNPHESLLWPRLSGREVIERSLYGMNDRLSADKKENDANLCSEDKLGSQDWWLVLYFANRLSKEQREVIRNLILNEMKDTTLTPDHMCNLSPSFHTAMLVVRQILVDATEQEKASMSSSRVLQSLAQMSQKENGETRQCGKLMCEDSVNTVEQASTNKASFEPSVENGDNKSCCTKFDEFDSISDVECSDDEANDDTDVWEKSGYSAEERAKAVEFGLRISLINDDRTERRFGPMLANKVNAATGARAWKLQQSGQPLLMLSQLATSDCCDASKIISLTMLQNVIRGTDNLGTERRSELNSMLDNIQSNFESKNKNVVILALKVISTLLKESAPVSSSNRDADSLQIMLATTGFLKSAFDIIARFMDDNDIVRAAIECTSKIMDAKKFSYYPEANKSQVRVITALIHSIVTSTTSIDSSAAVSSLDPELDCQISGAKNIITKFQMALSKQLQYLLKAQERKRKYPSASIPSTVEETAIDGLRVMCMIIRNDRSRLVITDRTLAQEMCRNGLKLLPPGDDTRRLLQRMRGLLQVYDEKDQWKPSRRSVDLSSDATVVLDDDDDDDDVGNNTSSVLHREYNLSAESSNCLEVLRKEDRETALVATRKLVRDILLPTLKPTAEDSPAAGSECLENAVRELKSFVIELQRIDKDLAEVAFLEQNWTSVAIALHAHLEMCATADSSKRIEQTASMIVNVFITLTELDKDFAVQLCGLEAKRTLVKLQEKYDSIQGVNELKELLASSEHHRAQHNKLLAVVLGGCISTSLQCVEEARRNREQINIPLFSHLLENLCKGSDIEMKEDKCWERLEVSTNSRLISKLTDGNPKTYWESNGSTGAHWINVHMKKGVLVRKMTILIAQEDSSYTPSRIAILAGSSSTDVGNQLALINVVATDREIVLLENVRRYWPVIRISVRRCQQGGIDTRIHGLHIVGPKPSFWPILRRQLYVRTCLMYSVQTQGWVADAVEKSKTESDVRKHKLLDISTNLMKAIEYEQDFADRFLPNVESSLVLGQACQYSLSFPVLTALLDSGSGDHTLLQLLLKQYVEIDSTSSTTDRVFSSRLRLLMRVLVDLDGGGIASAADIRNSKLTKEEKKNPWLWTKKMQAKHQHSAGNSNQADKISNSDSVASLFGGGGKTRLGNDEGQQRTRGDAGDDDDAYKFISLLPKVAHCWSQVVEREFFRHLQDTCGSCVRPCNAEASLRILDRILVKFEALNMAGNELFGQKSYFTVMFAHGIRKALISLSLPVTVRLCYVFNDVTNAHAISESVAMSNSFRRHFVRMCQLLTAVQGADLFEVFEHFYCLMLADRLLRNITCANVEKRITDQLLPCFPSNKPKEMLLDLSHSQAVWIRFLANRLSCIDVATHRDFDVTQMLSDYSFLKRDIMVSVLRPLSWPLHMLRRDSNLEALMSNIDQRLARTLVDYKHYFCDEHITATTCVSLHNKPLLHWTLEGDAVVQDLRCCKEFKVNTVQMIFLLMLNAEENMTSWTADWKAFMDNHRNDVAALKHHGVITEVATNQYHASDKIDHDEDCTPEQCALTELWTCDGAITSHFQRRDAILDCAIVQMIKQHGFLLGDVLIEMVIAKCYNDYNCTFIPRACDIRRRCELLLVQGYLFRKEQSPQILHYNPDHTVREQDDDDNDLGDGALPQDAVVRKVSCMVSVTTLDAEHKQNLMSSSVKNLSTFIPHVGASSLEHNQVVDIQTFSTQPTTMTANDVMLEIRALIEKHAVVLSCAVDYVEAKLIEHDWNCEKMFDDVLSQQGNGYTKTDEEAPKSPHCTTCPVCLQRQESQDLISPLSCHHMCCVSCWQTYLTMQITHNRTMTTTCPLNNCQARPTSSLYEHVFKDDAEMRQKYENALVRSYVEGCRGLSWCHNPRGCECIVRFGGTSDGTCGQCGWQTCFSCTYVEAHAPASCGHLSQWIDDGGYFVGMTEEAQSKHLARLIAKRCPNCQANIEKNDGCLHMKCSKCAHDFCWRCLQPWRPSHRDYYNCSMKVSKLAHAGLKFIEFDKCCQFHHRAKQFAFDVRERVLAVQNNCTETTDQSYTTNILFAIELCQKLAHCRKVLAYTNVYSYYSRDTEALSCLALHAAALENKTLALQEQLSSTVLVCADIENAIGQIDQSQIARGRQMMAECETLIKTFVQFSKQDMKVGMPEMSCHGNMDVDCANPKSVATPDNAQIEIQFGRPAGLSDDDDSDDSDEDSDANRRSHDSDRYIYSATDDDDDDDDDDVEQLDSMTDYEFDDNNPMMNQSGSLFSDMSLDDDQ